MLAIRKAIRIQEPDLAEGVGANEGSDTKRHSESYSKSYSSTPRWADFRRACSSRRLFWSQLAELTHKRPGVDEVERQIDPPQWRGAELGVRNFDEVFPRCEES